ncbi:MAG: hypothetical protein U0235_01495 [Polyangiaceae bacterium]
MEWPVVSTTPRAIFISRRPATRDRCPKSSLIVSPSTNTGTWAVDFGIPADWL